MSEVLAAAIIAAGLILPGWGWARSWGGGWVEAMVISWLAVFAGVMAAVLLGFAINVLWLGSLLSGVGVAGAWWARRRKVLLFTRPAQLRFGWAWGALPLVVVMLWRALVQPLSGVDVDFRWNYLAELMVELGELQFYPPDGNEDFAVYFWADGIPPLIAGLYAWTYLVAGETNRVWTAIPVLLQWAALLGILGKLGNHWGGSRGAAAALLFAGSTFLLQFSANLGQETACIAIGVGVMVYHLLPKGGERGFRELTLAAAGAALVASAREYGWAMAGVGVVYWVWQQQGLRSNFWRWLGWSWLLLPLLWYVRTWVRAGNPWLSLQMGGLFEVNPVFTAWMDHYRAIYGADMGSAKHLKETVVLFARTAAPAWLGLLVGVWFFWRRAGWGLMVCAAAASAVCWWLSVPYTAGGPFYAMRVLSPLLLLGCAWGGAMFARLGEVRGTLQAATGIVLVLAAADASLRALTVPANPWRTDASEWLRAGYTWQTDFRLEQDRFLDEVATTVGGRVLSDSAGVQRHLRMRGVAVLPFWSPEASPLFESNLETDAVAVLRDRGFSHLLVNRSDITLQFLRQTGALDRLDGRIVGVLANDTFALFELVDGPQ